MVTILTIIIGISILVAMMLFFDKRNDKIIEDIKSRGHFVVEQNGEVYYISANGERTKYVPAYEESSTTTPPTSTTEPTLPPLSEITLQELDARMRHLESEINRLWHTILRAR